MTPRQLAARLYFVDREERLQAARLLAVMTTASRGEQKSVEKLMKDLQEDFPRR
jgi:hypothetical protein